MINFKESDRKIFIKNVHNCSSLLEDHEIFFVRTNQSKLDFLFEISQVKMADVFVIF